MRGAEGERMNVGDVIIVRRYTGTMVARVQEIWPSGKLRVRLMMRKGWSKTLRTVAHSAVVGPAGTEANAAQRRRLRAASRD